MEKLKTVLIANRGEVRATRDSSRDTTAED